MLDLLRRRPGAIPIGNVRLFSACVRVSRMRHFLEDLIAHDLHRHGQIQGRILRVGRDLQMQMTTPELCVAQAVVLPAEDDGRQ